MPHGLFVSNHPTPLATFDGSLTYLSNSCYCCCCYFVFFGSTLTCFGRLGFALCFDLKCLGELCCLNQSWMSF